MENYHTQFLFILELHCPSQRYIEDLRYGNVLCSFKGHYRLGEEKGYIRREYKGALDKC